ncbi:MAG: lipid-A-disaccharide synthase [Oligoflexales bacterium]
MKTRNYIISCGEPSGDLLAADLARALKAELPGYQAYGIVGPAAEAEGVIPLASIKDLSVMGFSEVVGKLPFFVRFKASMTEQVRRLKPDFVILVDYPGFHLRWAEDLKREGVPVIQYVAPQLWAWGQKRVEKLRRVTDVVLGIMPFEETFFKEHGVNFHYVGTPQMNRLEKLGLGRKDFSLPSDKPVIGFFPGSRNSEVSRNIPVIRKVIEQMQSTSSAYAYAVSRAPSVSLELFESLGTLPDVTVVPGQSLALMANVDAALVASGTATLECGLLKTPLAVLYMGSPLTFFLAKRLVRLPYISLVNLVAGRKIVEEFIQSFKVEDLASHLGALAQSTPTREATLHELARLAAGLTKDPHIHGAKVIREFLRERGVVQDPSLRSG